MGKPSVTGERTPVVVTVTVIITIRYGKGDTVDCWAERRKLTEGSAPWSSECQALRVSAAAFQRVEHFPWGEGHRGRPALLSCRGVPEEPPTL